MNKHLRRISAGPTRFRIARPIWVGITDQKIISFIFCYCRRGDEWLVDPSFQTARSTKMSHFNRSNRNRLLIDKWKNEIQNDIVFFFWILGKTSFARSLPGFANHCRGVWSTDSWDDTADYMIIDDVPWDEFRTRGFPNPEELITCQQFLNVGDHIYIERNAEYLLWIRSKTNRIGFVVLTQQCQR